jgi:hypothetical protein
VRPLRVILPVPCVPSAFCDPAYPKGGDYDTFLDLVRDETAGGEPTRRGVRRHLPVHAPASGCRPGDPYWKNRSAAPAACWFLRKKTPDAGA